jgi:hypothetical protein
MERLQPLPVFVLNANLNVIHAMVWLAIVQFAIILLQTDQILQFIQFKVKTYA